MIKLLNFLLVLFLFSGCSSSSDEHAPRQIYFFDIKGYFEQQASKLGDIKITKTVSKNNVAETKVVTIDNWQQEFELFTESDINKPAWKDSYTRDSTASVLTYTAKDPDLRVQQIKIKFNKATPVKFVILSESKNLLYHTSEELTYVPDSLYEIDKHQKVILLGLNNYKISGKFH